uniref:LysM and putative peptidoglycan-binding domain-containing protein 2 n=1 Tax=Cairina moschata TaxID=8855 RepID=A0A8C3B8P4_CAIMO
SAAPSEAELSQRLARTKARSYGSTASVAAPLAERYVEHRLSAGDTLQGIALKYGVTMEQIKRANKLFTNDCIFLRKTLNIPVISEKPLLFNGLNSLESPENETVDSSPSCEEGPVTVQEESSSSPSPQEPDNQPTAPEELSAKDFLQRLDLQIKLSKQAARKLKDDTSSIIPVHFKCRYLSGPNLLSIAPFFFQKGKGSFHQLELSSTDKNLKGNSTSDLAVR